jgi:hypothetical protein
MVEEGHVSLPSMEADTSSFEEDTPGRRKRLYSDNTELANAVLVAERPVVQSINPIGLQDEQSFSR